MLVIALAAAALPAAAGQFQAAPPSSRATWVTGEILVRYEGVEGERTRTFAKTLLGREVPSAVPGLTKLVVSPHADPDLMTDMLSALPGVAYAEPNRWWYACGTPDPRLPDQWGLFRIKANNVWSRSQGEGVTIAILDTGVDFNHPDLAGKVVGGRNFTTSDASDYMDVHGHGTHCAGVAAATYMNGIGGAGTAPMANILAVKVLGNAGSGSTEWIANGIKWAADNGARVISMSLGLQSVSLLLEDAAQYAWSKGAVLVGAAGNQNSSNIFYPAASSYVIAVGATDANNNKASFSNFGSWVDVAAPGTAILSTVPGGGYSAWQGTSMAAPFVAGQAALIWSALGPNATNEEVRNRIQDNTVSIPGAWLARGLIDCDASVPAAAPPPPPPAPEPPPPPPPPPAPEPPPPPPPPPAPEPPPPPPPPPAPEPPPPPPPPPAPEPPPPPPTTWHTPNRLSVVVGKGIRPSVRQIVDSDGTVLTVHSLTNRRRTRGYLYTEVQFQGVLRALPANAQIEIHFDMSTTVDTPTQVIAFNWSTKRWELVAEWSASAGGFGLTTIILNDPARFVDSRRNFRFRLRSQPWQSNVPHTIQVDRVGIGVRG